MDPGGSPGNEPKGQTGEVMWGRGGAGGLSSGACSAAPACIKLPEWSGHAARAQPGASHQPPLGTRKWGRVRREAKIRPTTFTPWCQSQIKTHGQDGGACSYQQEATGHRQAVCVSPMFWPRAVEVLGQRGGGSGEKLESTREVPQVGGRLIAAGKERGGQAQLLGEVEGLDQDWGLWAGQG